MGKNIVLGITGGIAAYKMGYVASDLTKKDYDVNVVMTNSATEFVKPLTFRSLTHNSVETDLFSPPQHFDVKHVSLAKKADIILIAPATANFIGKVAGGIADDLLSTIVMATQAQVIIAPAMNVNMYNNEIVQDNIRYLQKKGYHIIKPGSGYLACGDLGKGRLPEPEQLVEYIEKEATNSDLLNKNILITAGPTREPLDPVRFITNYSSGKMGCELSRMASYRGANVTLVSGPSNLKPPLNVNKIEIETAREMQKEVVNRAPEQDIIIKAAAVTDYRPANYSQEKMKKDNSNLDKLKLKRNPDILKGLGENKKSSQLLIGFAAESKNIIENAQRKLTKKNLDMIVVNDISKDDVGFGSEKNQVTIITHTQQNTYPKMSKRKLANIILDKINDLIN